MTQRPNICLGDYKLCAHCVEAAYLYESVKHNNVCWKVVVFLGVSIVQPGHWTGEELFLHINIAIIQP